MRRVGVVLLTITLTSAVGYVVYKAYNTYQKEREIEGTYKPVSGKEILAAKNLEEKIATKRSLEELAEEARQELKEMDETPDDAYDISSDGFVKYTGENKMDKVADVNIYRVAHLNDVEEKATTENTLDKLNDPEWMIEGATWEGIVMEKEDDELRYDPNSEEALEQYKRMIFSDFEGEYDLIPRLERVFDKNFYPVNEQDANIQKHILIEREKFFGEGISAWNGYATFAELFIFFANRVAWNYYIDSAYVLKFILDNVNIYQNTSETKLSTMVSDIKDHNFMSDNDTYGIFGLTPEDYENNIANYPGRVINTNDDVTFAMEYNVWANKYADQFVENWKRNEGCL